MTDTLKVVGGLMVLVFCLLLAFVGVVVGLNFGFGVSMDLARKAFALAVALVGPIVAMLFFIHVSEDVDSDGAKKRASGREGSSK